MTKEEIKALVATKIKGQGTAVDMGSALPAILNGIVDIIPEIQGQGYLFGGVLSLDAEQPLLPNSFYLAGPGEYDSGLTIEDGYISVVYTDEDGMVDSEVRIHTANTSDEIAEIAKVSSGIIITYNGFLEVGVETELNGIKPDDIPYVNAIFAPQTRYGRFNVLTPMNEGNIVYLIEGLLGGSISDSSPDKAYFGAFSNENRETAAGISLTVSNGKVMIKFNEA